MFASDENVAVLGGFSYESRSLGKVTYAQFVEDTFANAAGLRTGGSWIVQTEPGTEPFQA